MLAEVFPLGKWLNFKQMEDSITLEELNLLLKQKSEEDWNNKKFAAALKGHDLEQGDDQFERVKAKAAAIAAGQTEEEYNLGMMGVTVDTDPE